MRGLRKLGLARSMRRNPSWTERLLWKVLRDRRLEDLKFRRQVPIAAYVVDFLCVQHKLIVEADGPFHDPIYDAARDAFLKGQGYRVLRFPNALIMGKPQEVLAAIMEATR